MLFSLIESKSGFTDYCSRISKRDSNLESTELQPQISQQESQLLQDVLLVLEGGEGEFITYSESYDPQVWDDRISGPDFKISLNVRSEFADIIQRIVEVCKYVGSIQEFINTFNCSKYGTVVQSLCCGFRLLYRTYVNFLNDLETSHVTHLNDVWSGLEPIKIHLKNAKQLIDYLLLQAETEREPKQYNEVSVLKPNDKLMIRGGKMLRALSIYKRKLLGDVNAYDLCAELIAIASKPYLKLISEWLRTGTLIDKYDEFMDRVCNLNLGKKPLKFSVRFSPSYYASNVDDMPLILSPSEIQNSLLAAGTYLHIYRLSKRIETLDVDFGLTECFSIEDPKLLVCLSRAYDYANTQALELVQSSEFNILKMIYKMRELYLSFDNKMFYNLVKESRFELLKPVNEVNQSIVQNAFFRSTDLNDIWDEYMKVNLADLPIKEQLLSFHEKISSNYGEYLGVDALEFEIDPPFPLNVVLTQLILTRYKLIFRHLMQLRTSYDSLSTLWIQQTKSSTWRVMNSNNVKEQQSIRSALLLRDKFTHVIRMLSAHVVDSINLGFEELLPKLSNVRSIDEVCDQHKAFLDKVLDQCMLMDPPLLKCLYRLITMCKQYVKFLSNSESSVRYFMLREDDMFNANNDLADPNEVSAWFAKSLGKYELSFNKAIKRLHTELVSFSKRAMNTDVSFTILWQHVGVLLERDTYEE